MGKTKMHYAYGIVVSCFLVQMVMLFGLQAIPLMLSDIAKDLQLSATEAGSLTAAFTAFYGFLGFVWGFISDKIGARNVLILGLIFVVVGFASFAALGTSYIMCCVTYAIVGIGCASFTVATVPRLMSRWFSTKKRHTPSSVCMMGGVFCGMIQGVLLPILISSLGWHGALWVMCGITVVFAVVIIVIVRNEPKDKGLLPCGVDEQDSIEAQALLDAADAKGKQKAGLGQFVTVLKMGIFWKIVIHTILYQMAYIAINSFLPSAIMALGYTRAEAGLVVTVYNLFQLIAMFAWGKVADKIQPKMSLFISLIVWTVGAVSMIWLCQSYTTSFIGIAITGLGLGAPGLMMAIFADYFPPEAVGTGSGVSSTIGTIGRTISPIIVGALIDGNGGNYQILFIYSAIFMLLGALVALTFNNIDRGEKKADVEAAA